MMEPVVIVDALHGQGGSGSAPTMLEISLCRIFAELFDRQEIDSHEDFFDLGGDSMMAEALAAAVFRELGVEFEINWLIEDSTPAQLAQRIAAPGPGILSEGMPPIFIVHGNLGFSFLSREFARSFPEGQSLFAFELPGLRGLSKKPLDRIPEIAANYVADLNAAYSSGPILLVAYCAGGLIGIEMANQLRAQGREVLRLVLVDPGLPESTAAILKLKGKKNRRLPFGRRLLGRLMTWRFSMPRRPFIANEFLRRAWEWQFRIELAKDVSRHPDRAKKISNVTAQAKLLAAYYTFIPDIYLGKTAIVASRSLAGSIDRWRHLCPLSEAHFVDLTHKEVVSANGGVTAQRLKEIFAAALLESQVEQRDAAA